MADYVSFRVVNFEKFQHYKNRNPPWIKLYNTVLDTYEFGALKDASKGHLLLIWLLASRHDNQLPWDARWIGDRIQAKTRVDLNELLSAGFLEGIDDASNMLAQDASNMLPLEEKRREEKRESRERLADFEMFWSLYPRKIGQGAARKAWAKASENGLPSIEILRQVLVKAAASQDWQKDEGQYIPHPATWLNGERWTDEYHDLPPPPWAHLPLVCGKCGEDDILGSECLVTGTPHTAVDLMR